MNERIKQLAKQAWIEVATKECHNGYEFGPNGEHALKSLNTTFEKFTELIVKECANICDAKRAEYTKLSKDADSFKDKNLWAEGEISAHRIRISIQEHFGVE